MGITRAKRELYLTHARTRIAVRRRDWNLRSRFIDEIPLELTDVDEAALTGAGRGGDRGVAAPRRREPRGGDARRGGGSFALGDDVVHAQFGDGVVIGSSPAASWWCASPATAPSAS